MVSIGSSPSVLFKIAYVLKPGYFNIFIPGKSGQIEENGQKRVLFRSSGGSFWIVSLLEGCQTFCFWDEIQGFSDF